MLLIHTTKITELIEFLNNKFHFITISYEMHFKPRFLILCKIAYILAIIFNFDVKDVRGNEVAISSPQYKDVVMTTHFTQPAREPLLDVVFGRVVWLGRK